MQYQEIYDQARINRNSIDELIRSLYAVDPEEATRVTARALALVEGSKLTKRAGEVALNPNANHGAFEGKLLQQMEETQIRPSDMPKLYKYDASVFMLRAVDDMAKRNPFYRLCMLIEASNAAVKATIPWRYKARLQERRKNASVEMCQKLCANQMHGARP